MDFGETVAPVSVASEHYVLPDGTGAIVSGFGTTSVRFVLSLLNRDSDKSVIVIQNIC